MVIVGTQGFAKEVLEIFNQFNLIDGIVFYDDYTEGLGDLLYDKFKIIKSESILEEYFRKEDNRFVLGIGNPSLRESLTKKLIKLGGVLESIISPYARIGGFNNSIEPGCTIMTGAIITNDITLGNGCLINLNVTIGHDSVLGDFVELSPNVNISGRCKIGSYTSVGTGAILIPDMVIGKNCVVAAGAVVTKNVPDNCLVAGVPAVIKKKIN